MSQSTSSSSQSAHAEVLARIQDATARVGVIGLGYVGLPLCYTLHEGGLGVVGFDIDQAKIEDLAAGRPYLEHFGAKRARLLADSERFEATADFRRLADVDVIIVCVPTPLGPHREPDLSYVVDAARLCGKTLRRGQLIVLESTTYPRTTSGEFLSAIRESIPAGNRLEVGHDFFVAFSPEREDPGRESHSTRTIPKLVGGLDPASTELAVALYRRGVEQVVPVSSAEVAEAAKLLENIFRAVNIALVNELKVILDAMDIDVWEVIDAASTKPFGFVPFYPGPGLGGHCIPIDPFYLSWKAKEVGRPTRFIELAGEINTSMPHFVLTKVADALNAEGKALKGARVLILGLAYKPNVDDTRESPSFELIEELHAKGSLVDYHDRHVPRTKPMRRHDLGMKSVELTPDTVASYDVVLVATDHKDADYAVVGAHARIIVDTRNVFSRLGIPVRGRLVKA